MAMATVNPARMTHDYDGELVVFLIGMRINQPLRPDRWWPAFAAMPAMLAELSRDPDSGLMGYRLTFGRGGPLLVQYWSSHEKLYAYASNPAAAHRPAWTRFNRMIRKSPGAVGIWHETYVVERAETIYSGMPAAGLAAATATIPVARRGDTARERLGQLAA
jgi:fumigallin biosynthesis monooxygenase-like protein